MVIAKIKNNVKDDYWDEFLKEIKESEGEKKEILLVIKEIIDHFTAKNDPVLNRLIDFIGSINIEYLITKLLMNRNNINSLEIIKEIKYLLYNNNILVMLSRNDIYKFYSEYPIIENTEIFQNLIAYKLLFPYYDFIACLNKTACEELEKLFKKDNLFRWINEYSILKRNYNQLIINYRRSYASLEDDLDHESAICKGVLFHLFNGGLPTASFEWFYKCLQDEDWIFLKFIDLFFSKINILKKEHLYLFQYILSDKHFLYRASGFENVCNLLDTLAQITDIDSEKVDYITSFFNQSHTIEKIYCSNYELFMLYFKIAINASNIELEKINDYLFNNGENFGINLEEFRLVIHDTANDFPEIYNIEMIISQSISIYGNNNIYSIRFFKIFLDNIKLYCHITDENLTHFESDYMARLQNILYEKKYDFLNKCFETIQNGDDLNNLLNSKFTRKRITKVK